MLADVEPAPTIMLSLVSLFAVGSYVHPLLMSASTVKVKFVQFGAFLNSSESNDTCPVEFVKHESLSVVAMSQ